MKVSFALAFADAEAAVECERYATAREGSWKGEAGDELAAAIRALPATGEVGRG